MPLTGGQIQLVAKALADEWTLDRLVLFASGLEIALDKVAPAGSLLDRARAFVAHLSSCIPPRDRDLLLALEREGNVALRRLAGELLAPAFYSSTGDAHDAIVIGKAAFVNRDALRAVIREFTKPNENTTRLLVVRGEQPCGKSYSWEYLRHLAAASGATAQRVRLRGATVSPRDMFRQVGGLLRLDLSGFPPVTGDDPQLARMDDLLSWFKGQLAGLGRPWWLVIDDLNEPSVTVAMREAAYAIAFAAEEGKHELWVALLGYNAPVTDPELRHIAQEDAHFPDPSTVARHFEALSRQGPIPLDAQRARDIAALLFAKFPKLDKEAMIRFTGAVELIGEKLRQGQQP